MPRRWKLTLAYDGRPFGGWQSQPGGTGVQDRIEAALEAILKQRIRLHGSGRTDAGVHALGQIAHFDAPEGAGGPPGAEDWQRALNANLPPKIRVVCCAEVDEGFHARFSAAGKEYRYRIWNADILPPLEHGLAWHLPYPIDLDATAKAVRLFQGEHDFANFAANRGGGSGGKVSTVRKIGTAEVGGDRGGEITIRLEGSGFLYKMVRLMVGAAVRVGQGKEEPRWIAELLADPSREKCAYCAPADGLCLVGVRYGKEAA